MPKTEVENQFEYAKEQLWEGKTSYYAVAPLLEYMYACLWTIEDKVGECSDLQQAITELDEYLYERLDV